METSNLEGWIISLPQKLCEWVPRFEFFSTRIRIRDDLLKRAASKKTLPQKLCAATLTWKIVPLSQ